MDSSIPWAQCEKTNATYLSCPTADLNETNPVVNIAIHNPSSLDTNFASILVDKAEYTAKSFNPLT